MIIKKITLTSFISFVLLNVIACNNNSTENTRTSNDEYQDISLNEKIKEDQKLPFSVTATELCSDFSLNETNALEKYKNNLIDLTGEVLSFHKSEKEDCLFIELHCEGNNSNSNSIVVSYCPDKDISLIEKIKEKEHIVIQGKFVEKNEDTIIMQQIEINSHPILD